MFSPADRENYDLFDNNIVGQLFHKLFGSELKFKIILSELTLKLIGRVYLVGVNVGVYVLIEGLLELFFVLLVGDLYVIDLAEILYNHALLDRFVCTVCGAVVYLLIFFLAYLLVKLFLREIGGILVAESGVNELINIGFVCLLALCRGVLVYDSRIRDRVKRLVLRDDVP